MAYRTIEAQHNSKKFEITKYDGMKIVAQGSIIITYNCRRIGIIDYLWVERYYENENFAETILEELKVIAKKEDCAEIVLLHNRSEWRIFANKVMEEGV